MRAPTRQEKGQKAGRRERDLFFCSGARGAAAAAEVVAAKPDTGAAMLLKAAQESAARAAAAAGATAAADAVPAAAAAAAPADIPETWGAVVVETWGPAPAPQPEQERPQPQPEPQPEQQPQQAAAPAAPQQPPERPPSPTPAPALPMDWGASPSAAPRAAPAAAKPPIAPRHAAMLAVMSYFLFDGCLALAFSFLATVMPVSRTEGRSEGGGGRLAGWIARQGSCLHHLPPAHTACCPPFRPLGPPCATLAQVSAVAGVIAATFADGSGPQAHFQVWRAAHATGAAFLDHCSARLPLSHALAMLQGEGRGRPGGRGQGVARGVGWAAVGESMHLGLWWETCL